MKKSVCNLRPGEIFKSGERRIVVVDIKGVSLECGRDRATLTGIILDETPTRIFDTEAYGEVEVETITPAMRHADELLALLRRALPIFEGSEAAPGLRDDMRDLLDKIEPPPVPTLEDALAALVNLEPYLVSQNERPGDRRAGPALEVLAKARRAGVVK